jgi:hypothetical protein
MMVLLAGLAAMLFCGCVSAKVPGTGGRLQVLGCGGCKMIGGRSGRILEITATGLSIRSFAADPGLSIGWHRTRLLFPDLPDSGPSSPTNWPVAVHTKSVGLDLAPAGITIGYDNRFAIPLPGNGTSRLQLIEYSENQPTNAVIQQE